MDYLVKVFSKETSSAWRKEPGYNLILFSGVQREVNEILRYNGSITMNKVLELLGMKTESDGDAVDWKDTGGWLEFRPVGCSSQNPGDYVLVIQYKQI